jgi:hypothetical protein
MGFLGYNSSGGSQRTVTGTATIAAGALTLTIGVIVASEYLVINWGDGIFSIHTNDEFVTYTHTYESSGVYSLKFIGNCKVCSISSADEFLTDVAAGAINGTSEDLSGVRTVVDTGSHLSISEGSLKLLQGVSATDPRLHYGGLSRSAGRIFCAKVMPMPYGGSMFIGFSSSASSYGGDMFFFTSGTVQAWNSQVPSTIGYAGAIDVYAVYDIAIVQKTVGSDYWIKGGRWKDWTFVFSSATGSGTTYPSIIGSATGYAQVDFVRVSDTRLVLSSTIQQQLDALSSGDFPTINLADIVLSTGDANILRTTINAIDDTWNSPYRRQKITLNAGTYNEIQLSAKKYVDIQGEGTDQTYIVSDGLRSDIDPVSGIAYSAMALTTKHGIIGKYPGTISNLSWSVNDVKYVDHVDTATYSQKRVYDNVSFSHANGFCLGVGLYSHDSITITNSVMDSPSNTHAIFVHSQTTQNDSCFVTLSGVISVSSGLLTLTDLGSGKADSVTVTDCSAVTNGIFRNAANSSISYDFRIMENGGSLPAFTYNPTTRPNALMYYTKS